MLRGEDYSLPFCPLYSKLTLRSLPPFRRFGSLDIASLANPNCLLSALSNFSLYSNEDIALGAFEAEIHALLSSKREGDHRLDKIITGESLTKSLEKVRRGENGRATLCKLTLLP